MSLMKISNINNQNALKQIINDLSPISMYEYEIMIQDNLDHFVHSFVSWIPEVLIKVKYYKKELKISFLNNKEQVIYSIKHDFLTNIENNMVIDTNDRDFDIIYNKDNTSFKHNIHFKCNDFGSYIEMYIIDRGKRFTLFIVDSDETRSYVLTPNHIIYVSTECKSKSIFNNLLRFNQIAKYFSIDGLEHPIKVRNFPDDDLLVLANLDIQKDIVKGKIVFTSEKIGYNNYNSGIDFKTPSSYSMDINFYDQNQEYLFTKQLSFTKTLNNTLHIELISKINENRCNLSFLAEDVLNGKMAGLPISLTLLNDGIIDKSFH